MMRKLLCLLTWIVIAAAGYGQVRSADILYTHHDSAPTRGFRVGEEVFVALEDVTRWEWTYTTRADLAFIKAEGTDIVVPTRNLNGRLVIPVAAAVRKAGGIASWDARTDTLTVLSELSTLRAQGGQVKLFAPFKAKPRAYALENPKRLVVDLHGVRLGPGTKQSLEAGARVFQATPNTVRLVIETENPEPAKVASRPTHSLDFEVSISDPTRVTESKPLKQEPSKQEPPKQEPPKQDPPKQDPPKQDPPATEPVNPPVLTLKLLEEDGERLSFAIESPKPFPSAAIVRRPQLDTIEVTLNELAMNLAEGTRIESNSVLAVNRYFNGTGTVLVIQFIRPISASVVTEGNAVRVSVGPPSAAASLVGKVIVVDPGHGGSDSGAKAGGAMEKELNLKIGKLIAQKLTEAGATVIMTRNTDVFVPLGTRAKIANDNNADFFVSTHINSTAKPATQSGTITFHHKTNGAGKKLAEAIQREIAQVNGLPDLGAWSDGRIYNNGFAVLRLTRMPGVLLELGFINHPKDRQRMLTQDFQEKVAAAVVRGIKVYLANGE